MDKPIIIWILIVLLGMWLLKRVIKEAVIAALKEHNKEKGKNI